MTSKNEMEKKPRRLLSQFWTSSDTHPWLSRFIRSEMNQSHPFTTKTFVKSHDFVHILPISSSRETALEKKHQRHNTTQHQNTCKTTFRYLKCKKTTWSKWRCAKCARMEIRYCEGKRESLIRDALSSYWRRIPNTFELTMMKLAKQNLTARCCRRDTQNEWQNFEIEKRNDMFPNEKLDYTSRFDSQEFYTIWSVSFQKVEKQNNCILRPAMHSLLEQLSASYQHPRMILELCLDYWQNSHEHPRIRSRPYETVIRCCTDLWDRSARQWWQFPQCHTTSVCVSDRDNRDPAYSSSACFTNHLECRCVDGNLMSTSCPMSRYAIINTEIKSADDSNTTLDDASIDQWSCPWQSALVPNRNCNPTSVTSNQSRWSVTKHTLVPFAKNKRVVAQSFHTVTSHIRHAKLSGRETMFRTLSFHSQWRHWQSKCDRTNKKLTPDHASGIDAATSSRSTWTADQTTTVVRRKFTKLRRDHLQQMNESLQYTRISEIQSVITFIMFPIWNKEKIQTVIVVITHETIWWKKTKKNIRSITLDQNPPTPALTCASNSTVDFWHCTCTLNTVPSCQLAACTSLSLLPVAPVLVPDIVPNC